MIIFLCVIMFSWAICGCGSGYEASIFDSISEMQEEFFVGQSQGIKASLVTGYREKEYIKDGCSGETIPFAILSFERVEKGELLSGECNLLSGDETYLGTPQKNPYTGALQVDLGSVYIGDTMVASIVVDGKTIDIALVPLFDSVGHTGSEALGIVLDKFGDEIKRECGANGKFVGEVYIKLLGTLSRGFGGQCWGITILKEDGHRLNFVVSRESGEVWAR